MIRTVSDTIQFIKEIQARYCLTVSQIFEICDRRGKYVSEKTISRIVKEGSEDEGFHLNSIVNVYEALYEEYGEDTPDDVIALKQIIAYRNHQIDNLLLQIEVMNKNFKEKIQLYEDRKQAYQQTIALIEKNLEQVSLRFDKVLGEYLADK